MASYKVDSAHTGYSDIHDVWVENGRPAWFDIMYNADLAGFGPGSGLFHVLDVSAENPDFYMVSSAKVTDYPDTATEHPTHKGMLWWNQEYWKMQGYADEDGVNEGDWHIKKGERPPNELVEG